MGTDPATNFRFREVYDSTFDDVRRFCLRRLPPADVNDAVSEVYLVAWRRLEQVPNGVEALPWLYAVARNVVRGTQRSSRRRSRLVAKAATQSENNASDPQEGYARVSMSKTVVRALEQLSESDQEIVRLRAWEELTAPAIATTLGCSVAAAEKRIARAFSRLESHLATDLGVSSRSEAVEEGGSL